jgi:hypothetical protein
MPNTPPTIKPGTRSDCTRIVWSAQVYFLRFDLPRALPIAPVKLKTVIAALASSGSKTAMIRRYAEGIYPRLSMHRVQQEGQQFGFNTYRRSGKDTRDGSHAVVGVLVGHEGAQEGEDPHHAESQDEDRFGREEVGDSTPHEEEAAKRSGEGGLRGSMGVQELRERR